MVATRSDEDDAEEAQRDSDVGADGPFTTDRARFDAVYREQYALVHRSLLRLGVAPEALDDAVQDVFLVVARRLDAFEGRSKMSTWIYGIVLRVASNHRRERKRRLRRHDALALEPLPVHEPGPESAIARDQGRRILHRVLDAMDDDLRDVFVLAEIEQVPGPEIASLLSLNTNTMHSRLRAARAEFDAIVRRMRAAGGLT